MNAVKLSSVSCMSVALLFVSPVQQNRKPASDGELAAKVRQLEKRVARLERLLLVVRPSVRKTLSEAEQGLGVAKQQLEFSERMARKGYITQLELAGARYAVEKARKQLALAKGEATAQRTEVEIQVLEAEHNVTAATEKLQISKRMVAKGYLTQLELQGAKLAVERARLELREAKVRLKA